MKTKDLIICAVFVAGAAVFYDTREICKGVAKCMKGADVREVNTFSEMMQEV